MASTLAPQIQVEPVQCPEAISKWLKFTTRPQGALEDPTEKKQALSLKARSHLCFLGWRFWHARKSDRWEMRYTSPTGKTYKSLRQACISCINEGGGESQNAPLLQEVNPFFLSTTGSSAHHPSRGKPNRLKKKPLSGTGLGKPSSSAHVKKGKATKRVRNSDSDSDSSGSEPVHHTSRGKPNRLKKKPLSGTGLGKPSSSAHVKKGKATKRVRNSDSDSDSDSSRSNIQGVLAWLIKNHALVTYSTVRCSGDVEKTGKVLPYGILCDCCPRVFSADGFVAHADCKKHRSSSKITLEDGRSLLDLQKEVLKKSAGKDMSCLVKEDGDFVNDSICSACGLGCFGDEILVCYRCPSSFHPQCLGVDPVPKVDWFCPRCVCKFCNQAKYKEDCVGNVAGNLLTCDQCELKYHIGCVKDRGLGNEKKRFCNGHCKKISGTLQELIGKPNLVGKRNHGKRNLIGKRDLTWTLFKAGDEASTQNQINLRAALAVLHDCFEPIPDAFFGRDIVTGVIFSRGSELDRLNCRGFYTMVLKQNDEVISVAAIRIFGQKVAEIPFVGTKKGFREEGMCRILMKEIETQLTSLGVERMILPSSRKMTNTWISSFGFEMMGEEAKRQLLNYTFLDLNDTIMCHKSLIKPSVA